MNKYEPLKEYLTQISTNSEETTLTFSQIEGILGYKLPPSARNYSSWWVYVRVPKHSHKKALAEAGWRVQKINIVAQVVQLRRMM